MSVSEASGLWDAMATRLHAAPATDGELWDLLEERADVASFRPQLAADIEIKEFHLRWGNDYAMIANPRELIHYELTPNQISLVKLMDGSRTVKEILVEGLDDAEALELSGLADLIDQLYAGGFLVTPYVDADTAVAGAIKPATTGQQKAREFVRHQTIDWKGADRFVRALYRGGVRFLFDPPVVVGSVVLVAVGLAAFVDVVSWHRFDLNTQNLAWGLLLLTFLNYFLTFCHELGHATGLVHFGEIALLLDVPRTASIVARTQVRAFRLDREGFDRLVREAFRRGTLNPVISPDTMWKH